MTWIHSQYAKPSSQAFRLKVRPSVMWEIHRSKCHLVATYLHNQLGFPRPHPPHFTTSTAPGLGDRNTGGKMKVSQPLGNWGCPRKGGSAKEQRQCSITGSCGGRKAGRTCIRGRQGPDYRETHTPTWRVLRFTLKAVENHWRTFNMSKVVYHLAGKIVWDKRCTAGPWITLFPSTLFCCNIDEIS